MNQKHSQHIFHVSVDVNLMVGNVTRDKNGRMINDKFQCGFKKPIAHRAYEEHYVWNPSTCACECDEDCNMGEYLRILLMIK